MEPRYNRHGHNELTAVMDISGHCMMHFNALQRIVVKNLQFSRAEINTDKIDSPSSFVRSIAAFPTVTCVTVGFIRKALAQLHPMLLSAHMCLYRSLVTDAVPSLLAFSKIWHDFCTRPVQPFTATLQCQSFVYTFATSRGQTIGV